MVYTIDSISHKTTLGQRVFFDTATLEIAGVPQVARDNFLLLKAEGRKAYALHDKFVTDGCVPAAAVRVALDMTTGVPIDYELKGRMFMAQTIEGDPIVICSFYRADRYGNLNRMENLVPRNADDYAVINIPRRIHASKKNGYDIMDVAGHTGPFYEAVEALKLGMGMINPYVAMAMAEKFGVKLLCFYDESLLSENLPLTTNVGVREYGIYAEDGREYIDIAINKAQPVVIDGVAYAGAIIGDISDKAKHLAAPPSLAQLYVTIDTFASRGFKESIIREAWQRQ